MLFVVNEHFFDGVEVAVAIHVVWLHVARFGPLVPTVDCDKRNLLGVAVNIFFCLFIFFAAKRFFSSSDEKRGTPLPL